MPLPLAIGAIQRGHVRTHSPGTSLAPENEEIVTGQPGTGGFPQLRGKSTDDIGASGAAGQSALAPGAAALV
jgi:hypothetical protein